MEEDFKRIITELADEALSEEREDQLMEETENALMDLEDANTKYIVDMETILSRNEANRLEEEERRKNKWTAIEEQSKNMWDNTKLMADLGMFNRITEDPVLKAEVMADPVRKRDYINTEAWLAYYKTISDNALTELIENIAEEASSEAEAAAARKEAKVQRRLKEVRDLANRISRNRSKSGRYGKVAKSSRKREVSDLSGVQRKKQFGESSGDVKAMVDRKGKVGSLEVGGRGMKKEKMKELLSAIIDLV